MQTTNYHGSTISGTLISSQTCTHKVASILFDPTDVLMQLMQTQFPIILVKFPLISAYVKSSLCPDITDVIQLTNGRLLRNVITR